MSQENVDLVGQSLDAFDRRDRASWLALRDEDVVIVPSRVWPEADVVNGREAAWQFYVKVAEAFERFPIGDAEVVDVGADKALVHQRHDTRGRASGAEVDINHWVVVTIRNGKIVREQWFADRAEALAAVGLRESAMSSEKVEVVRDALHAFAERGLAAMPDFWAADINWRAIEGAPDDVGEMQGAETLRHYFQDWIDTFDDVSNVAEELLDLGDDRVLAVQRATGRAKASGIETELRYAVVYTVRDGKIARGREYIDRATALEAAGLRE